MYKYYSEDPSNVVVVHCLAGRGRTGTVITSFLQYIHHFKTADAALTHFAARRSTKNKGVSMPSQLRYVHYFEELLSKKLYFIPQTLLVSNITIGPLPDQSSGSAPYLFEISNIDNYYKPYFFINPSTSQAPTYKCTYSEATGVMNIVFNPLLPISGDVNIRVRVPDSSANFIPTIVCRVSFNTYFVDQTGTEFAFKDIDVRNPWKSKVSKSLSMSLEFKEMSPPIPFSEQEYRFLQSFYNVYTSTRKTEPKSDTSVVLDRKPPSRSASMSPSPSRGEITRPIQVVYTNQSKKPNAVTSKLFK